MPSDPRRPPSSETREVAFSVRDLRANLESRARDLETRASDARAAVQRRLLTASQGFAARGGVHASKADSDAAQADSKIPSATHLVELARKPARRMADRVARLATDATDAASGARALPGFSARFPPPLPGALRERGDETARPEWDALPSGTLETGASGGAGPGAEKKTDGAVRRRWTPPRPPLPSGGASLDDLLRAVESKIEEKIGATPFSSSKNGEGRRVLAPAELLSKVHDAGNAAVREWMAAARDAAEAAALEKRSARGKAKGDGRASTRVASMTEAEFAEAEAAAAAMSLRIEERTSSSTSLSSYTGEEAEVSSSTSSDVSSSTEGTETARRPVATKTTKSTQTTKTTDVRAKTERRAEKISSLRESGRAVAIVTTASLPWMTGTAVNPLLRAAYLSKRGAHDVTLVVPWLPPAEQALIHPAVIFQTPEAQAAYVRQWVKDRCGFEPTNMKLDFYPGRYATDKYSIIPVGDVSSYITSARRDVAVLEEPEHLNWYHSGNRWSDTFEHVVGVVHTNYLEYARLEKHGEVKEAAMRFVNSWVSRVHCHKIIKLSDAVQDFPRSETMNVHGVSPVFLEVGRRKATAAAQARAAETAPDAAAAQAVGRTVSRALASLGARAERRSERRKKKTSEGAEDGVPEGSPSPERVRPSREVFNKGCYFLGKVVWGKGFHELLKRVEEHNASEDGASFPLEMDVFGSGEDFSEVSQTSAAKRLPLTFKGRADHASDQMHDYKVFVNPSLSDVVATTTAEALAMGKYVIVAKHPSNAFFSTFPNCLVFSSPEEFSACVKRALSSDPAPLSLRDRYRLSWEAATDRFLDAAELGKEQTRGPGSGRADKIAEAAVHALHSSAARVEPLRRAAGAGAATLRGPEKVDGKWNPPWVKKG